MLKYYMYTYARSLLYVILYFTQDVLHIEFTFIQYSPFITQLAI